ncbi:MAG TPA: hypothetical protein VNN62_07535 [Methylomirabilota bacterium]|nr:hypothetical protein [Methylomirabilota bacterium]
MNTCHRCQRALHFLDRVGRRDTCPDCGADLHCCLNCLFYDPHYANACREPNADNVLNKEAGNFCEYFAFAENRQSRHASAASDVRAKLEALFKKK